MKRIAIFGGTTEGRKIAQALNSMDNYIEIFVATKYGESFLDQNDFCNKIHIGRIDESEMTNIFVHENFDVIVDATHPFATEVSKNIKSACCKANIHYIRLIREKEKFDNCSYIDKIEDLIYFDFKGNVLFTTGSKETGKLKGFININNSFFIRILPTEESINACISQGFLNENIITGIGPFSEADNVDIINKKNIKYLVTKDSGNVGGLNEKISAAEKCGVDVIVIKRPFEEGISFEEVLKLLNKENI